MKKSKQSLRGMMSLIFCFLIISCGSSNSNQADQQNYVQQQTEQQKLEQLRLEQEEEQRKQEEQKQKHIQAINYVFATDSEASNERKVNGDYTMYIEKMRGIDFSQCPSDFATAYVDHIHAWEDAVKVKKAQAELKEYGGLAAAAGIIATIGGSDATPFGDFVKAENELKRLASLKSEEISRTWKDIEHIAVSYGAPLPK